MDLSVLEKIGLSKAEIQVYLALLDLKSTPSSRVVHETGLRKSTVYESIKRLQDKGLVSYMIKGSKRYYEAAEPNRILDFLEDKKRLIEDYEAEFREILPQLERGHSFVKPHAEAHVFAGKEGFKTMRRDVIKSAKGEHLLIGAISRENEVMPGFFKNWNVSRQLKKINMRILHNESARKKAMASREYMGEHFETRFLPDEMESPAVINIYSDRVVNVLWKGDYPLCFLLINKEISDSYRQYFNYLWNIGKE